MGAPPGGFPARGRVFVYPIYVYSARAEKKRDPKLSFFFSLFSERSVENIFGVPFDHVFFSQAVLEQRRTAKHEVQGGVPVFDIDGRPPAEPMADRRVTGDPSPGALHCQKIYFTSLWDFLTIYCV